MSNEYKKQVYKKWIERGRPWFDLDPKKEPTYAERQIIIEMKKQEQQSKSKHESELEESKKHFDKLYAKNQGLIKRDFPKTIFDLLKRRKKEEP